MSIKVFFVCLLGCLQPPEQFFSYPAAVTITGYRAANLDLCLALTAYSSEGSLLCHVHLLRHGTSVFKVISERPMILASKCHAFGEGAITTYFKVLGFVFNDHVNDKLKLDKCSYRN